jgi:hypothetical protein
MICLSSSFSISDMPPVYACVHDQRQAFENRPIGLFRMWYGAGITVP